MSLPLLGGPVCLRLRPPGVLQRLQTRLKSSVVERGRSTAERSDTEGNSRMMGSHSPGAESPIPSARLGLTLKGLLVATRADNPSAR